MESLLLSPVFVISNIHGHVWTFADLMSFLAETLLWKTADQKECSCKNDKGNQLKFSSCWRPSESNLCEI
ncbi:hypothetical protein AV530_015861 [Patagioenas fasciata monilis]|uniref:Uncharacterized protein n=1 Tax=Patagioenas fasciata monilis TaxID=372326 RepID=A0A1V4KJ49_PATFA|nr:hypothetical protein AV530_015861 [Patagioenas fasciata monilis]